MTRFERDLKDALEGDAIAVLTRRKAELESLEEKLRWTKNNFRRTCIKQEIDKLRAEYNKIDSNF